VITFGGGAWARHAIGVAATDAGILDEPTGAAALAGLLYGAPERAAGRVAVVLITGTGLKDHSHWPEPSGVALESGASYNAFLMDQALEILGSSSESDQ